MRRSSVFQADKLAEPGGFLTGEVNDLGWSIATGDGRCDADEDDVNQLMSFGSLDPRIFYLRKEYGESTSSHGRPP